MTRTLIHGLASTLRMRTAISSGQIYRTCPIENCIQDAILRGCVNFVQMSLLRMGRSHYKVKAAKYFDNNFDQLVPSRDFVCLLYSLKQICFYFVFLAMLFFSLFEIHRKRAFVSESKN